MSRLDWEGGSSSSLSSVMDFLWRGGKASLPLPVQERESELGPGKAELARTSAKLFLNQAGSLGFCEAKQNRLRGTEMWHLTLCLRRRDPVFFSAAFTWEKSWRFRDHRGLLRIRELCEEEYFLKFEMAIDKTLISPLGGGGKQLHKADFRFSLGARKSVCRTLQPSSPKPAYPS